MSQLSHIPTLRFVTVDHVVEALRRLGIEPDLPDDASSERISGLHLGSSFGVRLFEPSPCGADGAFIAYKLEAASAIDGGGDVTTLLHEFNAFNARVRYFRLTLRGKGEHVYCVLDADFRVGSHLASLVEDLHFFLLSMSQMLFLVSSTGSTRAPQTDAGAADKQTEDTTSTFGQRPPPTRH